jgi:hypothetical protein
MKEGEEDRCLASPFLEKVVNTTAFHLLSMDSSISGHIRSAMHLHWTKRSLHKISLYPMTDAVPHAFFSTFFFHSRLKRHLSPSGRLLRSSARTGLCRNGSVCVRITPSSGTPGVVTGVVPSWVCKQVIAIRSKLAARGITL